MNCLFELYNKRRNPSLTLPLSLGKGEATHARPETLARRPQFSR